MAFSLPFLETLPGPGQISERNVPTEDYLRQHMQKIESMGWQLFPLNDIDMLFKEALPFSEYAAQEMAVFFIAHVACVDVHLIKLCGKPAYVFVQRKNVDAVLKTRNALLDVNSREVVYLFDCQWKLCAYARDEEVRDLVGLVGRYTIQQKEGSIHFRRYGGVGVGFPDIGTLSMARANPQQTFWEVLDRGSIIGNFALNSSIQRKNKLQGFRSGSLSIRVNPLYEALSAALLLFHFNYK